MYGLVEMACMVVVGIIGILMVAVPQKVSKKYVAENPPKLMMVRILGVLMVIGCVAVFIMMFRYNYMPLLGVRYVF